MKKMFLLPVFLSLFISVHAQEITLGITTGSGLSPAASANASSMEASSVDLFHGQLALQLPLYTLQGRQLSLPVSLSYSQPVTEEVASFHPGWTGLGWTLQAGGVITRKLRGKPDETLCQPQSANFWPLTLPNGEYHQEDVFSFHFGGYSGSFFFHEGKLILQSDKEIIQLLPVWETYTSNALAGFTFLMPDGTRYTFGYQPLFAAQPNATQRASREESRRFTGNTGVQELLYFSAWYLTRIESPEGDVIEFLYERGDEQCVLSDRINKGLVEAEFYTSHSRTVLATYASDGSVMEEASGTLIYPSYLKRIVSSGPVDVEFSRSLATEKPYPAHYYSSNSPTGVENHFSQADIERITAARWYKLDAICFLDKSKANRCFKEYRLAYLQSPASVLKLISLNERAYPESGGSLDKPAYRFEYGNLQVSEGVFEKIDKVTYPTGGYTIYEYEQHEYYRPEDMTTYGNFSKGLRIKSARSYPSDGEAPWETQYHYLLPADEAGVPGTESSGVINRLEKLSREFSFPAMINNGFVHWTKTTNYDQHSMRLGVPQAGRIGYSSVYVQKKRGTGNGEWTHYTFRNYAGYPNYKYDGDKGERPEDYPPVGQILSIISQTSAVSYEYEEWTRDTIRSIEPQYYSFQYRELPGIPYPVTGIYTKRDTTNHIYYNPKYKLKKKIEYRLGSILDTSLVTHYTYNYNTGNIIRTDVENTKEGTLYTTRYNYVFNTLTDMLHFGEVRIDRPYEVITEKDGKVLGATLTEYTPTFQPWKTYRFISPEDIAVGIYKPAIPNVSLIVQKDNRYKPTATYTYDSSGLLIKEEFPGALPATIARDTYGRILTTTTGAFANRFTYNVHGVTSVTSPNGSRVSTEYNAFGEPAMKRDTDGNIIEKYDYFYSIQP